jgi:two-component system, chemotaxis family, CheB/CheR fusion protein
LPYPTLVHDASGKITGGINVLVDITERKLAEEEFRTSEERFRMVADNMSQLAWTCEEFGDVTWYNQRWLDYTGLTFEDMAGWGWSKFQHPDHLDRVVQGVKRSRDTGEIWEDIFPLRGKDGTYRWFLSRAVPILDAGGKVMRWFGTNTDITERKLAESALIKSEKLAAAGRLAGALAHEINNPLQAITNLMTILRQSPKLDDQNRAYANMAAEELDRVAHLTRQSLSFYRDVTLPSMVNLEEALDSTLTLYDKQIKAQEIAITKQYKSHGAQIKSYPGEIRQVFSTLLVNAIEAVPKGGSVTLRISKSRDWNKSPASRCLRVTLADNGCGIPAHHTARLFEPFFTTKGENGTGLGLWVAHGIVSRLGGSMSIRTRVQPAEESGTCFSIFLPSVENMAPESLIRPGDHA